MTLDSFHRITSWMARHAPAVLAQLRPPASDAELAEAERALGFAIPDDLRGLLREHDGSADEGGFWGFLRFVPASLLAATRDDLMLWVDSDRTYAAESPARFSEVHAELASDDWLAIGHQGYADQLALHARTGRVFAATKDVPALALVAPSLAAYLDGYADELEAGRYAVTDGFGGAYLERAS